jgi:PEP-CTERM motif
MILIKGVASLGAAMLIALSAPSAQAGYVVHLTQQGTDVVATGSGAIDLTGLTFSGSTFLVSVITPNGPDMLTGPSIQSPAVQIDGYLGFTGPTNFGSGPEIFADSGSGDLVGIFTLPTLPTARTPLFVPHGYVSDSPLSSTATWDRQTLSSLGATPGTYEWTWGAGANQNFTLVIGTAATVGSTVPEPSTWAMMLIGFAGLGFMGYQKRRAPPDRVQRLANGRRVARWP